MSTYNRQSAGFRQYLRISRPRFWPYLLGPFLIGAAAAGAQLPSPLGWWLVLLGLFFAYPANFIIYGINDVYDYETDKANPKKKGYETVVRPEQRWHIMRHALAWIVLGYLLLEFVPGYRDAAAWGLLGFYGFGVLYSMPPVRAKAKPFLDSAFNILYVFPGVVGYSLVADRWPSWQLLTAAGLWCMAMHAYSAVPDIAADKRAKLQTIATYLGARRTLLFCAACYLGAAALAWPWLGWFSIGAGATYLALMAASFIKPERKHVFGLYRYFPYVNMAIGAVLFFWVVLRAAS